MTDELKQAVERLAEKFAGDKWHPLGIASEIEELLETALANARRDMAEEAAKVFDRNADAIEGLSGEALQREYAATTRALADSPAPASEPNLCDDEGCPHHGRPHVCITKPAWGDPEHERLRMLDRLNTLESELRLAGNALTYAAKAMKGKCSAVDINSTLAAASNIITALGYPTHKPNICDCELSHNGLGLSGRECDCPAGNPAPVAETRPETGMEHIARDMAEGRFPKRSERQTVPVVPAADAGQAVAWMYEKNGKVFINQHYQPWKTDNGWKITPLHPAPVDAELKSGLDIADAVVSWMINRGWLDADSEYYATDVVAALNDSLPKALAAETGQAVAWQAKGDDGVWRYVEMPKTAASIGMDLRPLYTHPAPVDAEREYVIWSNEHSVWWGPNEKGYVRKLNAAGIYTRHEALKICARARGGREFNDNPSEVPVLLHDAEVFWPDDTEEWAAARYAYRREQEAVE